MRLKQRKNVLLPHPDGPISAVTRRSAIVRFRSLSACFLPYQKSSRSTAALTWAGVDGRVSSAGSRARGMTMRFLSTRGSGAVAAFWNWLSRHGRVRMEGFEQSTRSSRYDLTIGR